MLLDEMYDDCDNESLALNFIHTFLTFIFISYVLLNEFRYLE